MHYPGVTVERYVTGRGHRGIKYHLDIPPEEKGRSFSFYKCIVAGGKVEQTVSFDLTPCNYGGHRTWFLCPRCWKRVAVLYGAGKYFLCRHCYDLTYSSQQENRADRLMRKARKIRERMGGGASLIDPFPDKPKNMHWKTYWRLRERAEHANNLSWLIMERRLSIHF
jgi:hypothetical protein